GLDRRLEPELDQAETVSSGQVPPRLPAEHGRRVEQDDPLDLGLRAGVEEQPGTGSQRTHRIGLRPGPGRARDPLRDLGLDLLRHGGEQVRLVAELVVQGAPGHPGGPDDLLRAHLRVSARTEQRAPGAHQAPPGGLRPEIVLGPGHMPFVVPRFVLPAANRLLYVLSVCKSEYIDSIQTVCMLPWRSTGRIRMPRTELSRGA